MRSFSVFTFLPARRYAGAVFAVTACPSVRLSVCHKTVLYQNGWTSDLQNNATTTAREPSFMVQKISTKFWWDRHHRGAKRGGVGKNCVFRPVENSRSTRSLRPRRLTAENLCSSATVRTRGEIRCVINNNGGSRSWLITVTV